VLGRLSISISKKHLGVDYILNIFGGSNWWLCTRVGYQITS